jgi:hypothetical protein
MSYLDVLSGATEIGEANVSVLDVLDRILAICPLPVPVQM